MGKEGPNPNSFSGHYYSRKKVFLSIALGLRATYPGEHIKKLSALPEAQWHVIRDELVLRLTASGLIQTNREKAEFIQVCAGMGTARETQEQIVQLLSEG